MSKFYTNPTIFHLQNEQIKTNPTIFHLQEIENFILRMAAIFPQRREQIIFIINNYDVILSVMGVRTVHFPRIESFNSI